MSEFKSHTAGSARIFDPLYDPLFTVSGTKDFSRAMYTALSAATPIRIQPKLSVMFSNLPKTDRIHYEKFMGILPHFRPEQSENGTFLTNNARNLEVIGRHRPLFIYYSSNIPKVINLQLDVPEQQNTLELPSEENQELKVKAVGCQTMFRESSAQTHPYRPEAVLASYTALATDEPEILLVDRIFAGQSKPPGEYEAEIMERMRLRRKWEKSLPRLLKEDEIQKRRAILEAFEWEEWIKREKYIEEIQNMRLEIVFRLVKKREEYFRKKSQIRLESSIKRINKERKDKLQKLECDYLRKLRKLNLKRQKISLKYRKENILTEYTNLTSERYLPHLRNGVNPNRRNFIGFQKKFSFCMEELDKKIKEENSASLKCSMKKYSEWAKPKQAPVEISYKFLTDENLSSIYDTLKMLRKDNRKRVQRKIPEIPISSAPVAVEIDPVAEADYQYTIYLQKIIKGRAIQKILSQSKESCRDVLKSIRSTYTAASVKFLFPSDDVENRTEKLLFSENQNELQGKFLKCFSENEAREFSVMLNFLENEYTRICDDRKIHALLLLAGLKGMDEESREKSRFSEKEGSYKLLSIRKAKFYLENVLLDEMQYFRTKEARDTLETYIRHLDKEIEKFSLTDDNNEATKEENSNQEKFNQFVHKEKFKKSNKECNLIVDYIYTNIYKRLEARKEHLKSQQRLEKIHKKLYENSPISATENNLTEEIAHIENLMRTIGVQKNFKSSFNYFSEEDFIRNEILSMVKNFIGNIKIDTEGKSDYFLRNELNKKVATDDERNKILLNEIIQDIHKEVWNEFPRTGTFPEVDVPEGIVQKGIIKTHR